MDFEKAYARAVGKRQVHELYRATLANSIITPKQGCRRLITTIGSDERKEVNEPGRRIFVDVGQHLLVYGRTIEETARASVVWAFQAEWSVGLVVVLSDDIRSGRVWIERIG